MMVRVLAMVRPGKRKLTLTVDNEVVEKAKKIGLNLSDITERVLRGFAFSPKQGDKTEVYSKYRELFDTMKPILADYGVSVEIAHYFEDAELMEEEIIRLTPTGELWSNLTGRIIPNMEEIPLYLLLEPKQILANFIESLSEEKQKRHERLGELEMAKRIILAMNETLAPRPKSSRGAKQ